MRTLKFRFYDSKYKIMRLDTTYAVAFDGSVKLLSKYKDNASGEYHTCGNGIIPMQWTGLTDRYGVEIYEGDIVKAGEANMPIDRYPDYHQVCQVKFGEGAVNGSEWPVDVLGFYLEPHRFKVPNITEAKLEVIGNIYENPELLEEPKL